MTDPQPGHDPETGTPKAETPEAGDPEAGDPEAGDPETEAAEPLNRAERRAKRRGKKPPALPTGGQGVLPGHQEQVRAPRRSGRRGNR